MNQPSLPSTESALDQAQALAFSWVKGDSTGHDEFHLERVKQMALRLGKANSADLVVVEWAALFHDALDAKLIENSAPRLQAICNLMQTAGLSSSQQDLIIQIIRGQGFAESLPQERGEGEPSQGAYPHQGGKPANDSVLSSLPIEFRVVQDADRLDAMGAIGIARCFAYGGRKGQVLHDPQLKPRMFLNKENYRHGHQSSLNHFHEKLLLLKDLMHTNQAKSIAETRHIRMLTYLDDFDREWALGELDSLKVAKE